MNRIAIIILLLSGEAVSAEKPYEIRADHMETSEDGSVIQRKYSGSVEAILESTTVRSGGAVYTAEKLLFYNRVELVGPGGKIRADSLSYRWKNRRIVASGGVILTAEGRELQGDRINFFQDRIEAIGRVSVWYDQSSVRLAADSLEIEPGGRSGTARGRPRLTRSDFDSLTISGNVIRFSGSGEGIESEGDVVVESGPFFATCQRVLADTTVVTLSGDPLIRRFSRESDSIDTTEVFGDWMELKLKGNRVGFIKAVGGGKVLQNRYNETGKHKEWSMLEGDTISVEVQGGSFLGADSKGTARTAYRGVDSSNVELEADDVVLAFYGNRVQGVIGEGRGKGIHTSGDRSEITKLGADRIEIEFEKDRIGKVILQGHAICEYLPAHGSDKERGGKNRLSGDHIRLALEDGSLQRAVVEGAVVGSYWMTEGEKKSRGRDEPEK